MTPSTPNTADLGELVEELRQRSLARVATAPNPKRLSANARCDIRLHNAAADLLTAQQREIEEWRKCYSDRIEAERATIRAEAEAEVAELRAQLSAATARAEKAEKLFTEAFALLDDPARLREAAKLCVGGAQNRCIAEADAIERLQNEARALTTKGDAEGGNA